MQHIKWLVAPRLCLSQASPASRRTEGALKLFAVARLHQQSRPVSARRSSVYSSLQLTARHAARFLAALQQLLIFTSISSLLYECRSLQRRLAPLHRHFCIFALLYLHFPFCNDFSLLLYCFPYLFFVCSACQPQK